MGTSFIVCIFVQVWCVRWLRSGHLYLIFWHTFFQWNWAVMMMWAGVDQSKVISSHCFTHQSLISIINTGQRSVQRRECGACAVRAAADKWLSCKILTKTSPHPPPHTGLHPPLLISYINTLLLINTVSHVYNCATQSKHDPMIEQRK